MHQAMYSHGIQFQTLSALPTRARIYRRRTAVIVRSSEDENSGLENRISSGNYSVKGSFREKLTRPVRKTLANDPIGPGALINPLGFP